MKKDKLRIALAVVNDLNYDQRMQKICSSLFNAGFVPVLIGRKFKDSKPLKKRVFLQKRFNIPFEKGKLFYLFHNFRLLIHYLVTNYDIFVANDLDTLPAAFVASKIKRVPYVYDAHEYFPQLPEVVDRPFTRKVWEFVEQTMVPQTPWLYTINNAYASIFKKKYNLDFEIVSNIAVKKEVDFKERKEKFILYQGAVNVGRGVEEMIKAMQFLDTKLVICGKGDKWDDCVQLAKDLGVEHKVVFKGFVEPELLREITLQATMGFTFFTDKGDSYYYSLANRFFDYMQNGVPQLCVNFPEYKKINDKYCFAILIDDLNVETIVEAANKILNNQEVYNKLFSNCMVAREKLNWQNEEKKLIAIYKKIEKSLNDN